MANVDAEHHNPIGTCVLLSMYLEDAQKAVNRVMRQKVPLAAKEKALGLILSRLEHQIAPERERMLPGTSFSDLPSAFQSD